MAAPSSPAIFDPRQFAADVGRLADKGETLAAEMATLFRMIREQRYAPVRVPPEVLAQIELVTRDGPPWIKSVDETRQRVQGGQCAAWREEVDPVAVERDATRIARVFSAIVRAQQVIVERLPALTLRGSARLIREWPLFAGIPQAVRRLVPRPLSLEHTGRLIEIWWLVLEALKTALPAQTSRRQLEQLAQAFPGSRGPGAGSNLREGAQRAAGKLELRATLAGAISLFVEALAEVLPNETPKQRLQRAARAYPATTGTQARDGTQPIGIFPPPDVIHRYVRAYRQCDPAALQKTALRELEILAKTHALKGSYRTVERRLIRSARSPTS